LYISKIYLKNFRNYSEQTVNLNENVNIIYGKNAQGKTNLIESVFLCSTGRSHRTIKDNELIMEGKNSFSVRIDGMKDDIPFDISIHYEKGGKKVIKVNSLKIRRFGEMIGVLNTVIFSPDDLQIVKKGPAERRRFLDILISQTNPSYFYNLQKYQKTIKQKNALLRKFDKAAGGIELLHVFNQKQAEIGSRIIQERIEFIDEIKEKIQENHSKLTKDKEIIEIKYISSAGRDSQEENVLFKFLDNNTKNEIRNQACLYGPHRDDMEIYVNNSDLRSFGSQGQQRTAVLSLKLTEIQLIREKTGHSPVLLLDDVMSELDISRKRYLLDNIDTRQTLITGTEKRTYSAFEDKTTYLHVVNGTVEGK
jgi:DNA replication and repair protein RecF